MRRSVVGDSVIRLTAMLMMAIVATAIVNLVLWRIVTRPLGQLIGTVKEIGQGELGAQSDRFRSLEFDFLAREINAMSVSLAEADDERRRQMAQAREIQRSLLPKCVDVSGLGVTSEFLPADDVGGDYFDVLPLQDGSHVFAIADAAGHGIPAAMSAAMLKVLLVQAVEDFTSPAAMLTYINRALIKANLASSFVTMALARVVRETSRVEYASAGHEPSWLLSPDGTLQELPSTGMILGVQEPNEWADLSISMEAGQRLFMATDGVSEALSPQGELFGRNRIREFLERYGNDSDHDTLRRLTESLERHRAGEAQHDDITMLLVAKSQ